MQGRILWLACASALLAPSFGLSQEASQAANALDRRDKDLLATTVGLTQSPTRVIVRFRSDVTEPERAKARSAVAGTLLIRSGLVPGLEVLDSAQGASAAIAVLKHNPLVKYAEFDSVVHAESIPNDHQFSLLWALNDSLLGYTIHAPEAWTVFTGDPNFVIADIDTGMDISNVDLAANVYTNPREIPGNGIDDDGNGYVDDVNGWDFYDNDNSVEDPVGHGTHTAGTMGAVGNNALGIAGVNWQCKLMPLKFMGPNGGYSSDAIRALQYAVKMGVKISNNSWGNTTYEQSLTDAIAAAQNAGHLFVAAAGNTSGNTDVSPQYPASYTNSNIISVAAVDNTGTLAYFSSYGASSVDLAAPGVDVYSTVPGNQLAMMSGTSMASPHVAGVAALLWAYKPSLTWLDVKNRILAKVQPNAGLKGLCTSGGMLDAYASLTDSPLPPFVAITTRAPSAMLSQPQVLLAARALDGLDGDISGSIVWKDSVLGQISTGPACFTASLPTGSRTITASVTDSRGLVSSTTTTVQVCAPGPTVSGLPTNSLSYPEGAAIAFSASATDPSSGSLTSAIQWSSSLQGSLGSGGAFNHSDLAPGIHVITAIAANSTGVTGGEPIRVTIIPATSAPTAPSSAAWTKTTVGSMTYIKVYWNDNSANETSFDVEVSYKVSSKSWSAGSISYHAPGSVPYVLISPASGYTWRYRVRARNSVGVSAWSNYTSNLKL